MGKFPLFLFLFNPSLSKNLRTINKKDPVYIIILTTYKLLSDEKLKLQQANVATGFLRKLPYLLFRPLCLRVAWVELDGRRNTRFNKRPVKVWLREKADLLTKGLGPR